MADEELNKHNNVIVDSLLEGKSMSTFLVFFHFNSLLIFYYPLTTL